MYPVLAAVVRSYAGTIMLPVAILIGSIGYAIEWKIRDKANPTGGQQNESVESIRDERLLEQIVRSDVTKVDSLKEKKIVPKTIFDKNLSPSLQSS